MTFKTVGSRIDVITYPGIPGDRRGWQVWPHCDFNAMVDAPTPIAGKMHYRVNKLCGLLVAETELMGYDLLEGQCWGFDCRPIRDSEGHDTDIPSNHSSGTACDLNSLQNGYGHDASYTIPLTVTRVWKGYGWRWGGDYPYTYDYMHLEFMGTPAQADEYTRLAVANGIGKPKPVVPKEDAKWLPVLIQ